MTPEALTQEVERMQAKLRQRFASYAAIRRPETTVYADYGPTDERLDREAADLLESLRSRLAEVERELDLAKEHARQLERELTAAREALTELVHIKDLKGAPSDKGIREIQASLARAWEAARRALKP